MAQLNFNRAPYYDDYTTSANYVRILFRDGFPVQTRELNNIQSAFQDQIRMFGEHVFKNGARVSGARMMDVNYDYVALDELSFETGKTIAWKSFKEGWIIQGRTTRLTARIVWTAGKSVFTQERILVYLSYTGTAIDGETRAFLPGEILDIVDTAGNVYYSVQVSCPTCKGDTTSYPPVGKGTLYIVEDGVFFYNGMFVETTRQIAPVSYLWTADVAKVDVDMGFQIDRSIVTSDTDESIHDNSLGYANKTSPGADRYKINFTLVRRMLHYSQEEEFIPLARWIGGNKSFSKPDNEYAVIHDELAKRTYEESGDYTVVPFNVSFIEELHSTDGTTRGFSSTGSADNFVVQVTPSIHYVRGNRVQNAENRYVISPKARSTKTLLSYAKQFDELSYVVVNPKNGSSAYPGAQTGASVNDGSLIELYDGPLNLNVSGSFLPTGTKIGTMRVLDMVLESGVPGANDATYRYYLYDLKFIDGKSFNDVESLFHPTNKFVASSVKVDGRVVSGNGNRTGLIWPVGKFNTKSMRDGQNASRGSTTYTKRAKLVGQADSQGTIHFNSGEGEMFVGFTDKTLLIITTNGVPATVNHNSFETTVTASGVTIKLGATHSGKNVTLITDTVSSKSFERSKKLRTTTDVITQITPNAAMSLSKADIRGIYQVVAYNRNDSTGSGTDIDLTIFYTNNGQTEYYYGNGSFGIRAGKTLPKDIQDRINDFGLRVSYEYYEHSSSAGFLNIDSYSQLMNDGIMKYEHVPVFVGRNGAKYSLANSLDFRPLFVNGVMKECMLPSMNDMAFFDLEYYLPRTDLLQVDVDGNYTCVLGVPDDNPKPPKVKENNMALAEVWVPAYVYDVVDVKYKKIETKRYTMRDIGRLANRLKNVEYYTSLNMLEKSASDMAIKDTNGFDKFKNGFVVDDFSEFQAADLDNSEFHAAIDRKERTLRPSFGMRNRRLKWIPSQQVPVVKKDGVLMLDYTETPVDSNLYATKHISVNPYYVYTKVGSITITPAFDTWSDTTTVPEMVINQDFGTEAYQKAAQTMNSLWGAWQDMTTLTERNNTIDSLQALNTGAVVAVDDVTTSYDLGDRLTDVRVVPYMRENTLTINAQNLAPETTLYAFFDDKPVNEFCRPINGEWGDALVSDASGAFIGEFKIPAETFFTGEKKFKLTSSNVNSPISNDLITTASGVYYAGGIESMSQSITFNATRPIIAPDVTEIVVPVPTSAPTTAPTDNGTGGGTSTALPTPETTAPALNVVTEGRAADWISPVQPAAPVVTAAPTLITGATFAPSWDGRLFSLGAASFDPVAQSFMFTQAGFMTSYDVYFQHVDLAAGNIWCELRTTENGVPTSTVLDHQDFAPGSIQVSDNASVPHTVTLKCPVYLKDNEFYAIVVGGASPNTRIWVSKVGDPLVDDPGKIMETQGSLGSSFRSQNGRTWTAEQWEDLKYEVRAAWFNQADFQATFEIVHEIETLGTDVLESSSGSSKVRVYAKDHACSVGDKVQLYLFEDATIEVLLNTVDPDVRIGDVVYANKVMIDAEAFTVDGVATISAVTWPSTGVCSITLSGVRGTFASNAPVSTNRLTASFGTVASTFAQTMNGIGAAALNAIVIVTDVDAKDTFVFDCGQVASSDGMFGGSVKARMNVPYDTFHVAGSYMTYGGTESWALEGVTHNHYNSSNIPFANYVKMAPAVITPQSDNNVIQTYKIIIDDNASQATGGHKTFVTATIKNANKFLSPTISEETMNMVLINNRVSSETTRMDIEPNATGRWIAETDAKLGVEAYKYVTKVVRLTKPSEDLLIMLDANINDDADFQVFYRKTGNADNRDITNLPWIEIPVSNKKVCTAYDEFMEYELTLSKIFASTWALEDFISTFQVKIVGKTENSAQPPRFKNLRIIAVT